MKKIIIIGAGISGLTAGIFAEKMGFNTEIYEMHSIPGGECTGWTRKGYHFDNCIHWLTGTNKETDLYKLWTEVGALGDIEIYNSDYLYSFDFNGQILYLYSNLDKLENHFLEISPEDREVIVDFIDIIRKMQDCTVPTKKPMDMMNIFDYIKIVKQYGSAGKYISKLSNISIEEYASRFKNKSIQKLIIESCPEGYNALGLFFTLATITSGNGGWPKGGSLEMSLRMEGKYRELGGKIIYSSKARKIVVENRIAKGVELENGDVIYSDYVVSAVDANMLMKTLLEDKFKDKVFDTQFKNPERYKVHSSVNIGLGVRCDLSNRDESACFNVEPFRCGNVIVDVLGIKHYCKEKGFAPKGCSSIRVNIMCDDYEYWKELKERDEKLYYIEKDNIAKEVIKRVEKIYPETVGGFEVYDVCTPITYERYCGAYRGSWMGFDLSARAKNINHCGKINGVKNLFIAGQWVMMPGGLPAACLAGKWAIQRICKEEKIKFTFQY